MQSIADTINAGFAHISMVIVPGLKVKGGSEEVIRTILVDNPRRALTFVVPQPQVTQNETRALQGARTRGQKKMTRAARKQFIRFLGACALATAVAAGAQQAEDTTRTLIVGENPSIDHKAKPGGFEVPSVTTANFWRVSWSPVGPGVVCFVIVNDPTPAAQKFVITDNPKLAEYIASKEVLARLIPTWNDPPFKTIIGTVTQKTDGTNSRTETCKGGGYTVELKWTGGLSEPRWIDFGFARQFGVIMTLSGVNSKQQEIIINGKRAPGEFASGFLALNETWRLENGDKK